MIGLTKKQQEVLSFIQEFIVRFHYSPSFREIKQHFGFASLGTVSKHVDALKRKGALTSEKRSSRSIHPIITDSKNTKSAEIELPYIGYISEGLPVETFAKSQMLAVPEFLVQSPDITYLLRSRGNTLISEMIADGDLILVEARNEALSGEMVVATLAPKYVNTTVKRYFPEGKYIRLEGKDSHLKPLIVRPDELQVHGVIIGLIRLYK